MTDRTTHDDSRTNPIEQYRAYLQDVGNIGVRHENSRKFYLSVVSALFVFVALAGKEGLLVNVRGHVLTLSAIVGMLLCIVWVMHMESFRAIYRAKFDVLRAIEGKHNLSHIFDEERRFLKGNPRYKLLTVIDSVIPILFLLIFVALLYFK
jgi:hypothetical protein